MAADALFLAFQSIKTATDLLGAMRQAEKSYEAAEFKFRIADLMTAVAEAKIQLARVQDYLRELEEKVAIRASLTFDRPTNVYRDVDGAPFCPRCFDGEGKACRMSDRESSEAWRCMTCERVVWKPGFPKRVQQKPRSRGKPGWVSDY